MATGQTYSKAYLDKRLVTVPSKVVTANYTLTLADAGMVIEVNTSSAVTITIPTNASVAFLLNTVLEIYAMGAGTVTIVGAAGVTVQNAGQIAARYATVSLRKRATNEWVLNGETA